jgi:nitroreductase
MKEAKTTFDIHSNLKNRWSPRAFSDKKIETEKLQNLFEAARWTPSAFNAQPWYFIVGQNNDTTYKKIFDCLVEFNQMWAKFAPVLVLSIGTKIIEKTGELNSAFRYDVGQSVAHLTFQAMEEDLYVHQMTGFNPQKAVEIFDIPEDYEALSVFAIGYLGDPSMLDPRMQKAEKAERERKLIKEFVFENTFGQPSELIK